MRLPACKNFFHGIAFRITSPPTLLFTASFLLPHRYSRSAQTGAIRSVAGVSLSSNFLMEDLKSIVTDCTDGHRRSFSTRDAWAITKRDARPRSTSENAFISEEVP